MSHSITPSASSPDTSRYMRLVACPCLTVTALCGISKHSPRQAEDKHAPQVNNSHIQMPFKKPVKTGSVVSIRLPTRCVVCPPCSAAPCSAVQRSAVQRSAAQRSAVQFDFLSGQTISTLDRNVFACFRVCVCVCVQTRVLQWRMESRKLVGCKSLVRHIPQLPVLLVCLQRPAGRRHPPIMAS